MGEVYNWIKNIVIYMILNTIIMNLLGDKSYKKYISIISGMILVLIVISPLMKLMKLDENLDYYLQSNDFSIETSEFKSDLSRIEKEQRDAIFADYEEKVKIQTKELLQEEGLTLTSFDLTINQDVSSSAFGEIQRMDITAAVSDGEGSAGTKDRLHIADIEVTEITIGEQESEEISDIPTPLEINVKSKLSDFYNIEQGNINISVQGG